MAQSLNQKAHDKFSQPALLPILARASRLSVLIASIALLLVVSFYPFLTAEGATAAAATLQRRRPSQPSSTTTTAAAAARQAKSTRQRRSNHATSLLRITRAVTALCEERASDYLRSAPIDEMQASAALPLIHTETLAGLKRAERLLPTAKRLTRTIINELAREYGVRASAPAKLAASLDGVSRIKPDVELRDNAAVYVDEPAAIHFGTIFLAGLPSDEAMTSVLAHELTHVADGRDRRLRELFARVGRSAAARLNLRRRIPARQAEELTCDLVGLNVARRLIESTPNMEPYTRRIARAVEHNCVESDRTDRTHLSPRNTLRALFVLDRVLVDELSYPLASTSATSPLFQQSQTTSKN